MYVCLPVRLLVNVWSLSWSVLPPPKPPLSSKWLPPSWTSRWVGQQIPHCFKGHFANVKIRNITIFIWIAKIEYFILISYKILCLIEKKYHNFIGFSNIILHLYLLFPSRWFYLPCLAVGMWYMSLLPLIQSRMKLLLEYIKYVFAYLVCFCQRSEMERAILYLQVRVPLDNEAHWNILIVIHYWSV